MPGPVGAWGPRNPESFAPYLPRTNMDGIMFSGAGTVDVTTNTAGVSATVNKAICAYFRVSRVLKVKGLILPQGTTKLAGTTPSIDWNLGLWTMTTAGSGNWLPSTLVTGAEGLLNQGISTANETNFGLAFASTVTIPPGDYGIAGCYRYNGTITAGLMKTILFCRSVPFGAGAMPEGRYDLHSATTVTYTAGTIAALFSGLSWNSVASGSFANINFNLWCEQ